MSTLLFKASNFIKNREKLFSNITKNFKYKRISNLVVCHKINKYIFNNLYKSANLFFQKSKKYNFVNMTPNGKLVPKKEIEKEYNNFIKNYYELIKSMNLHQHVKMYIFPVLRFKQKNINKLNKTRSTRSELPHSDAWAGWGSNSVLIIIPISGDIKNNKVVFFDLPRNLKKNWLLKKRYTDSKELIKKCNVIKHHFKIAYVCIADISVLHVTKRLKKSKDRLSIDIPLMMKGNYKLNKFQKSDAISPKKISLLSKKNGYYLSPYLKMGQIDGKSAKILPSSVSTIKIS